jgi:hypothetical protein
MNQEFVDNIVDQVKNFYCEVQWNRVVEHFGEEAANDLDLLDRFDFAEVFERGDLKECEIFYNIAFIQKVLINALFDIGNSEEAQTTFTYLEYWIYKLFDRHSGVEKGLWLQ